MALPPLHPPRVTRRNKHKSRGLSHQSSLVLSVGSLFVRTPGSYVGSRESRAGMSAALNHHRQPVCGVQRPLPRAWPASKCAFWKERKGLRSSPQGCLASQTSTWWSSPWSQGNVSPPKPAGGTVHPHDITKSHNCTPEVLSEVCAIVPRREPKASDLPLMGQRPAPVTASDHTHFSFLALLKEGSGTWGASVQLGLSHLLPRPKSTSGSFGCQPRTIPRRDTIS